MYLDGRALEIKRWKKFVGDLLEDAEELLNRRLQFQSGRNIDTINLHEYVDNPNLSDAGHYFVLDKPGALNEGRRRVMRNLRQSEKWNKLVVVEGDGISFDVAGVDEYEADIVRFLEYILLLMNMTCGQSGRGTEMTALVYKNTMEGNRNILIEDGQIMFVSEYHKSMAVMNDVKVYWNLNELIEGHTKIFTRSAQSAVGDILEGCPSLPSVDQSEHASAWISLRRCQGTMVDRNTNEGIHSGKYSQDGF